MKIIEQVKQRVSMLIGVLIMLIFCRDMLNEKELRTSNHLIAFLAILVILFVFGIGFLIGNI